MVVGPDGFSNPFKGSIYKFNMNSPSDLIYYLTEARLLLIPLTFLTFLLDLISACYLMWTLSCL